MGDLSLHFDRDEFRCQGKHCCDQSGPVSERLVLALEHLRAVLNDRADGIEVKLHVSSGFRCRVHNREIGGDPYSYHCTGEAADVVPEGCSLLALAAATKHVPDFARGGVELCDRHVHVDVRKNGPWRGSGRSV